eukprot:COSAG06_NODE_16737_length_983_cov_90.252262_2_plen_61_part_01
MPRDVLRGRAPAMPIAAALGGQRTMGDGRRAGEPIPLWEADGICTALPAAWHVSEELLAAG